MNYPKPQYNNTNSNCMDRWYETTSACTLEGLKNLFSDQKPIDTITNEMFKYD